MNRIYKVIWNKARNCYMAVAEFVKRQGKSSSGLNRRHIGAALGNQTAASLRTGKAVAAALLAATVFCAAPGMAMANSGGTLQANGDYIGVAPYTVTIDEDVNGSAYGRYETDNPASGAMLSISTGGKATAAFGGRAATGDVTGNKVTMSGGEIVSGSSSGSYAGNLYGGLAENGNVAGNEVTVSSGTLGGLTYVYGGLSEQGAAGGTDPKDGNKVTITGGTVGTVQGGYSRLDTSYNSVVIAGGTVQGNAYGGESRQGNALNNSVTVKEGTENSHVFGGHTKLTGMKAAGNKVTISGGTVEYDVFGGDSYSGNAENNTVTISGGTVNGDVYGGYSYKRNATGNKVILSKQEDGTAPVISGTLFGGFSYDGGTVSNNTLQVEAVGLSAPEIQNFDNYRFVLPSDIEANEVMLELKNQGSKLEIDGTKVDMAVAKGSGLNIDFGESITLLHKTGGEGAFSVKNLTGAVQTSKLDGEAGGLDVMKYKLENPADKLNVTVSELFLYGDGGTNTPGQRQTGNTLTITSGKATAGFGGRASSGDVTKNNVEMSGGELVYDTLYADIQGSLYGGLTDKGNANHNTVTVSGGKLKERVYGGASYDGNTENNTARISGGTVGTQVYGGRTYGGGNAVNNTVTIEGGTVGKRVYGGRSDGGNAVNNTVTIEGGTVGERVYGGRSDGGNAVNNTVTIEGGTVGERVYGGYASAAATGNAVNLTDTTHGLDGAKLYGYNDSAASHSGNELHVGGAKTYDKNGEAVITKGSWQGMDANGKHTNRVDTVANFDSIALHNVVWGDVPAISANEITNIGGLDVTGLEFFTHPNNSTVHEHAYKDYMVLVHSDGSELTGLSISYLDEGTVKKEPLTNEGIYYHETTHHSTENGVTVDGIEKKRIYLAGHNKSVDFSFHVDGDKIILGDVAFVKGGTARTLDGRFDVRNADIDAGGLKMTGAGLENAVAGDAMTVVDAEDAIKAKGATATMKAFADKTYVVAFADDVTTNLTLSGTHTDTLSQNAEKTKLTYTVGEKNVSNAALIGNVAWQDGATHYANTSYNFNADAKTDLDGLTFGNVTADPAGQSMTLINGKAAGTVENAPASFGVSLDKANTTLDATAAGTAAVANGDVTYRVTGVTLDKVTVNQVTASADAVPDTWTVAKDATGKAALTIDTENMTLPSGSANKEHAILTVDNDSFAGATVTGQYAYASHSPFTKANGGVSIAGEKEGGVKLSGDNKSVVYHVVQDHVKDVTLGSVTFAKDATLLTVGDEYEFKQVNAVNAQKFAVNYAAPENVAVRDSMALLQANNTLQANALLQKMAADVKTKTQPYSFAPVDGVTVAAKITGSLGTTAKGDGFIYTVNSNQADSLTFGSVDWKDGGILLTRPANITFAGAAVDTSKIHFKNVHGLDADKQMTLVSDFGNKTGKITGSKYYIGTTLEGEGSATLNGNDLVFTTKTGIKPLHAQEQTHNTVMGQTAGISLLASGGEQIGQALNSLSLQDSGSGESGSETGSGTGGSSDQQGSHAEASGGIVASVGGGHMHQETGSHVTSNSWNGVLGIGGKRAGKNGTLQYLAFAEHGRTNFTLHSDTGRGDGTSKYVGGGLIGKWQNRRDVYVEASIRAGRMHDTANHMLYDDATGRSYGYDVHANYIGGHVGLGKVFYYDNGRNLDVYARYFHMKREGVSFDAGGHFDLDSVTSSVLRVGARYGATDKKWNWYGGLAYEYEFDGKATGRADGAPIRAASMEGGSVRAEIGLRMEASKTSPWKADINLSGYAGKRRGISGNVAVAYTF